MELEKVAKIDLEEEAYLKPISDRGIGFYNLDKNTAQFQFRVTKDNLPLLISTNNVKGYAFFKQITVKNGDRPSTSGVLDVEFIDPMTGLIGVTVPPWFLKNVTNSTVLGELYLSLNDVGLNGKDDTVVLGTFKFTVRDSLINQIESDIKVSYIRMFDELRSELEKKVQQLKQDIGDTQTLIETIRQTAEEYLIKINKAQADAIVSITDALMSSNESIGLEREEALRQIDAKRDAIKTDYDLASDTFKKTYDSNMDAFNFNVNQANATIDEKVNSFNETLKNDGFTTPSDVEQKFTEADWQKYKLTSEKGESISVDLENNIDNLDKLEPGFYYITNTPGVPYAKSVAGTALVIKRDKNSVKQVIFFPFTTNSVYINSYYNNWSGWQQVGGTIKDTGWVDLPLINGVIPYGTTYRPVYRLINENGLNKLYLKGAVKNITSKNVAIAKLPTNITSLVTSNMPFPQIGSNKSGISTLIRWSVTVNGAIQIDGSSMDTSQMSPDGFYPINTSMLL